MWCWKRGDRELVATFSGVAAVEALASLEIGGVGKL